MPLQAKPARTYVNHHHVHDPHPVFEVSSVGCGNAVDVNDVYWRAIKALADLPAAMPAQLKGRAAQKDRVDFQGYIRQGHDFWLASQKTASPSNALLLYYSFMQLAKAEILLSAPQAIQRHHGLSTQTQRARSIRAVKEVVWKDGVFPQLMNARTGGPVPVGDAWNIVELMQSFGDSGWDMEKAGHRRHNWCHYEMYVADDGQDYWLILNIGDSPAVTTSTRVRSELAQRGLFLRKATQRVGISHPDYVLETAALSRQTTGKPTQAEIDHLKSSRMSQCAPLVGVMPHGRTELGFLKSTGVPVSPTLARYACLHLLSSLVRYRPGLLFDGEGRYLAQSFLADSVTPLLQAAYAHLASELLVVSVVDGSFR